MTPESTAARIAEFLKSVDHDYAVGCVASSSREVRAIALLHELALLHDLATPQPDKDKETLDAMEELLGDPPQPVTDGEALLREARQQELVTLRGVLELNHRWHNTHGVDYDQSFLQEQNLAAIALLDAALKEADRHG